jgi:flagellar biosynthesis component FlhA
MRNQKSLILIVATIMLFSFAVVPPANALVGLTLVLSAVFSSALIINETVVKPNYESKQENSASKQKTQDNLQALYEP